MKFIAINYLAVMFLFSSTALAQEPKQSIETLGWISGCWEQNDSVKQRFGAEQWMK
ncbi:MAG: hypothetical protein H7070_02795, partial [Saprospiraceae bacterium]|nr:hypothetical protein [Pyrinomonadaceae bacterium]